MKIAPTFPIRLEPDSRPSRAEFAFLYCPSLFSAPDSTSYLASRLVRSAPLGWYSRSYQSARFFACRAPSQMMKAETSCTA